MLKFSYYRKILIILTLFIGAERLSLAMDQVPLDETLLINQEPEEETFVTQFRAFYGKSVVHLPTILFATTAFAGGLYLFYNSYDPHVMTDFLAHTFFNDSEVGMEPSYNQFDSSLPYSNCFNSCTALPIQFLPNAEFFNDSYHGPGYLTWVPDAESGVYDGVFNKGNISDMLNKVMDLCGCTNLAYWEKVVDSILNGAQFDPAIINCTANLDNETMCCGSGWGIDTWPNWFPSFPNANLSLRMVSGSGVCAQAQADQTWGTNLKILGAFGSLVPTSATLLALWARIKCSRR